MKLFVDLSLSVQIAGQPPRVTFHLLQTQPAELEVVKWINSLENQ